MQWKNRVRTTTFGLGFCSVLYGVGFGSVLGKNLSSCSVRSCWVRVLSHLWSICSVLLDYGNCWWQSKTVSACRLQRCICLHGNSKQILCEDTHTHTHTHTQPRKDTGPKLGYSVLILKSSITNLWVHVGLYVHVSVGRQTRKVVHELGSSRLSLFPIFFKIIFPLL